MEQNNIFMPRDRRDINKNVYTFLHLEESDTYQILHNETDNDGINKFQLYGRFIGEKFLTENKETVFLVKEVNFKLINIIQNQAVIQYGFDSIRVDGTDDKGIMNITANLKEIPYDEEFEKNTHHRLIDQPFKVKLNQKIDYHLHTSYPKLILRNGIPCNTVAYFSI
ncbi:hypothetical protein IMCC3317_26710 [Kordia antarctica]|uniref:Uncharacterized protein n=1 Tax=Kordia antarctica TaxID=1218801 RepID=A0A7L4ZL03_9FLAO|nr:hypothetical protein [Kordia antarctica]QHI37292.1 hypothetical protein IMCC3317_26710 [Kordia antarctica]